MNPDPQTGSAPTTKDENLAAAAAELAPHLSLQRIEATAKFVLATVAVVGAALTGFGAFGSSIVADHPFWALPSLALASIAVTLATLAAVGRNDSVNVDDLNDVESYYETQIARRGTMVFLAGLALAAALLLASLPLLRSATTENATASTQAASSGSGGSQTPQPPPGGDQPQRKHQ